MRPDYIWLPSVLLQLHFLPYFEVKAAPSKRTDYPQLGETEVVFVVSGLDTFGAHAISLFSEQINASMNAISKYARMKPIFQTAF